MVTGAEHSRLAAETAIANKASTQIHFASTYMAMRQDDVSFCLMHTWLQRLEPQTPAVQQCDRYADRPSETPPRNGVSLASFIDKPASQMGRIA